MQNNHEEVVRPFARIMASEISQDDAEMMVKKGLFLTFYSGHAVGDKPDSVDAG
jgi:hypothetical protein